MLPRIEQILKIEPYKIFCGWNTNEIKCINFEPIIKNNIKTKSSKYKLLLDKEYFAKAKVNKTWGTIYFPNGLDFDPDTLYSISIPAKITSEIKMGIKVPKTRNPRKAMSFKFYEQDLKRIEFLRTKYKVTKTELIRLALEKFPGVNSEMND